MLSRLVPNSGKVIEVHGSLSLSFLPEKEEPQRKGKYHGDCREGGAQESDPTEYIRHESDPNQHIKDFENLTGR